MSIGHTSLISVLMVGRVWKSRVYKKQNASFSEETRLHMHIIINIIIVFTSKRTPWKHVQILYMIIAELYGIV